MANRDFILFYEQLTSLQRTAAEITEAVAALRLLHKYGSDEPRLIAGAERMLSAVLFAKAGEIIGKLEISHGSLPRGVSVQ